jgi:hypothetical protein
MSGAAALNALKKIKYDASYEYMGEILVKVANGDRFAINSSYEPVVACNVLGEWNDVRAIPYLMNAIHIKNGNDMPEVAILALSKYPAAKPFLDELAANDPFIKEILETKS